MAVSRVSSTYPLSTVPLSAKQKRIQATFAQPSPAEVHFEGKGSRLSTLLKRLPLLALGSTMLVTGCDFADANQETENECFIDTHNPARMQGMQAGKTATWDAYDQAMLKRPFAPVDQRYQSKTYYSRGPDMI